MVSKKFIIKLMQRVNSDWETVLWFLASLGILFGLAVIFWSNYPERNLFYQPALVSPLPIDHGKLEIQLEKAEISKVSEAGREWEIHTNDLRKDDKNIYLNGVLGLLYQKNKPIYRLEAQKGQVVIESSDTWLTDVQLVGYSENGLISGQSLSWLGQDHFLKMENVVIKRNTLLIESKYLWYDLSQGVLSLHENVVITLKIEGNT